MPNFASVLKDEILRLARKEVRREVEGLKKASAQYRSDIAALKRRVDALEKARARAEKKGDQAVASKGAGEEGAAIRFSAKGLVSQRQRLGLSAAEMGTLLGVSAQTVYNWESGKSRPRKQQLAVVAAVRKMGKRQITAALAQPTAE